MDKKKPAKHYSVSEEILHSITHGIGALLSAVGLVVSVVLASRTGDTLKVLSFVIFGVSMFMLYTSSTLYHAFTHSKTKIIFRYIDHISIFLLIAGTYTPVALILLKGTWGWILFSLTWTLAIAGIIYEVVFLSKYKWISISIYLGMGWIAVVAIQPLSRVMSFELFMWILGGGLFYTLGTVFYLIDRIKFFHFIWHMFVVAGTTCHFFGLTFYLI